VALGPAFREERDRVQDEVRGNGGCFLGAKMVLSAARVRQARSRRANRRFHVQR